MSVPAAYGAVLLIWASTPLAIQWSNDSLSPIASVTARLAFALPLAWLATRLLRRPALDMRTHWKLYVASGIGLFPNMPLVYWAAQFIPSGLIAVLFGVAPFMVALLSRWLLGERSLGWMHFAGMGVALAGLGVIFLQQLALGEGAIYGVLLMMASAFLFSVSGVLVKKYASGADALNQLVGSLLFAVPGLLLTWEVTDGSWPEAISTRSALAVLYLATIGSVLGFVAYFYLLSRLSATSVALISLLTPALALWLGAAINGEALHLPTLVGSAMIMAGLALFNGVLRRGRYNARP